MKLEGITEKLYLLATTYGIRLLGVVLALIVAWVVAAWVDRMVSRGLEKAKFDATLGRFFSKMARYAILVFAILGCLGVFGIQTTSFAAVLAAAGLAIGLAFQGSLSNLAAGVMLLIFRPYKIGDVISAAGQWGVVEEVDLFTTILKTFDNRQVILPNGSVFGSTIENITHHPIRRVEVPVGVSYDADVDQVRGVFEKVLASIPGGLKDPAPQVFLAELGGSSVDWKLRVWCKTQDFWDVHQHIVRNAKYALDEANISIPFPQVDVHFDGQVVEGLGVSRGRNAHA